MKKEIEAEIKNEIKVDDEEAKAEDIDLEKKEGDGADIGKESGSNICSLFCKRKK